MADGSGAFVERDSAGVTIAESGAPEWANDAGWRVAVEPSLEIGMVQGEAAYQLYQVRGAARLADGRIVIANGGTSSVRWYDGSGRFLWERGGPGGGPDEFQQLSALLRVSPMSIGVYDSRRGAVAVFDSAGGRSNVEVPRLATTGGGPARLTDDRWVGWTSSSTSLLESGSGRDTLALIVTAGGGGVADTLGSYAGSYRSVNIERGAGGQIVSVTLFRAAFPGGARMAVRDGEILIGEAQAHALDVIGPHGALRTRIRWTGPDLTVTEEMRRAVIDARVAAYRADPDNPFGNDDAAMRASLQRMPFPERRAAYTAIRTDPGGNIWLERERMPNDETERHLVLDPNGRLLGEVAMPGAFRTFEIGEDYVLGAWHDEFDVERVRLYPLERVP